jgi:alkanesulfonate monooxygenase SsuD/methylene tetrahydromethanopterin reductase-like flavin-dependent oxidoreductase (luciferase family)
MRSNPNLLYIHTIPITDEMQNSEYSIITGMQNQGSWRDIGAHHLSHVLRQSPVPCCTGGELKELPMQTDRMRSVEQIRCGVFDHLDDAGIDLAKHYANRLRLVEQYDRSGFYAYHVAEHHGTQHGLAPSPNLLLAAMAQRTTNLRLGPLVMVLMLYHPLRAFEEICMLDQISNGRVELGTGRGAVPAEGEFYGVDPEHIEDRYNEASAILLKAMAGGTLDFHGVHFNLNDVPIVLSTFQKPHPPLWYGTNHPEAARWAAVNRMNIVSYGRADAIRAVTDQHRKSWAEVAAPEEAQPKRGIVRQIVVAPTFREAWVLAKPAYERWYHTLNDLRDRKDLPRLPGFPSSLDEAVGLGLCFVGPPAAIRNAMLRQIDEAGVNYVLWQIAFGNLPVEASLRTTAAITAEIMPALGGVPC